MTPPHFHSALHDMAPLCIESRPSRPMVHCDPTTLLGSTVHPCAHSVQFSRPSHGKHTQRPILLAIPWQAVTRAPPASGLWEIGYIVYTLLGNYTAFSLQTDPHRKALDNNTSTRRTATNSHLINLPLPQLCKGVLHMNTIPTMFIIVFSLPVTSSGIAQESLHA